jgi:hypothetical protein
MVEIQSKKISLEHITLDSNSQTPCGMHSLAIWLLLLLRPAWAIISFLPIRLIQTTLGGGSSGCGGGGVLYGKK